MGNTINPDMFHDENENEKLVYAKISYVPSKKIYGWIRDLPDERDLYYKRILSINTPKIIDLRNNCPDAYDQGSIGSSTANALAFLFEYNEIINNNKDFKPSRLFIYYNQRKMNNTTDYDSGASIRDSIKSIIKTGICDEKFWEYDIDNLKKKPPPLCYIQSKKYKSIKYFKLTQKINDLKACLQYGYPFVVGISIYESFENDESATSGFIKMPLHNEKLLGGHTVAVVGFDDNYGFLVRNSWGTDWGIEGHCFIPYEYICNENLASDLWTIRI